jgi:hypothetical protein
MYITRRMRVEAGGEVMVHTFLGKLLLCECLVMEYRDARIRNQRILE